MAFSMRALEAMGSEEQLNFTDDDGSEITPELTSRTAEPNEQATGTAGSAGAVSRDEPGEVDARPAGTILDRATVETAVMGDGRYVIYYSWPDDV